MDKNEWILKRVAYIKGLKTPSDMQKLIVELHETKNRTANESKQLDALLKVERINERAEEAKAKAYKIVNARKEETRKARTRELIELGGIVQLTDFPKDKGILTGGLLYLLDQFKGELGEALQQQLKIRGDKLLEERELEKSNN